jgi:glycosyltransferase involved in cell wall biosynthesis
MKVLIVCGAGTVAGKEIMTLELARGLRDCDLDVQVLVSSWGHKSFHQHLVEAGLPFVLLPLGFISATLTLRCLQMTGGQMARWPELLRGYRSLIRALQPTKIVHTNWHHLLVLLPFLRPSRDLFWLHEVIPEKRQYKTLFRMLSRRLQCFVAVSDAVAESLRRIGIPDRKIQVIHNGLTDPSDGLARDSLSNGVIRLGIAGQINTWKGHDDLLEAFGYVSGRWPKTELHIFGRGSEDYEHELRQRVRELSIVDRVTWHGFVANRAAIFSKLDICVVPSRSEDPLPTVAIEAASFGLPVVATRRGGLPEIIEDGITGFLVPSNDPTALAEGIQRLLADPDLRRSMGVKARKHMLQHFSSERFVREFLSLLGVDRLAVTTDGLPGTTQQTALI